MALKPEMSIMVGLAVAGAVYAIHSNSTPPLADIRVGEPYDPDIESSERTASWLSAAVVGAVALLAKDATVAIIGLGAVVAMSWTTRHADAVNPDTSRAVPEMYGRRAEEFSEVTGDVEPVEA